MTNICKIAYNSSGISLNFSIIALKRYVELRKLPLVLESEDFDPYWRPAIVPKKARGELAFWASGDPVESADEVMWWPDRVLARRDDETMWLSAEFPRRPLCDLKYTIGGVFVGNGRHYNLSQISREDPYLIQLIEEMGTEAVSTPTCRIQIAERSIGSMYAVDTRHGYEEIVDPEKIQWQTASIGHSEKNVEIVISLFDSLLSNFSLTDDSARLYTRLFGLDDSKIPGNAWEYILDYSKEKTKIIDPKIAIIDHGESCCNDEALNTLSFRFQRFKERQDRDDPILVIVAKETLKTGPYIRVKKITAGSLYRILLYDHNEYVQMKEDLCVFQSGKLCPYLNEINK